MDPGALHPIDLPERNLADYADLRARQKNLNQDQLVKLLGTNKMFKTIFKGLQLLETDRLQNLVDRVEAIGKQATETSKPAVKAAKAGLYAKVIKNLNKNLQIIGLVLAIKNRERIFKNLQNNPFTGSNLEQAEFWTSIKSIVNPILALGAFWGIESKDFSAAVEMVKIQESGAKSLAELEKPRHPFHEDSLVKEIVEYSTLIKAAATVLKIAIGDLGSPTVAWSLTLIASSASLIKAFGKVENTNSGGLKRELKTLKDEVSQTVRKQIGVALTNLDVAVKEQDYPFGVAYQYEEGLKKNQEAFLKSLSGVDNEEALLSFLETYRAFLAQNKEVWYFQEVDQNLTSFFDRANSLINQKEQLIIKKSLNLTKQLEKLERLLDELKTGIKEVDPKHPYYQEIHDQVKKAKKSIKDERKNVSELFKEASQLKPHHNIDDWLQRVAAVTNRKHYANLKKMVDESLDEPWLIDILHI